MTPSNRSLVGHIIVTALCLMFIAPAVSSGFHFHGTVVEAAICAALFTGIVWGLGILRNIFIVGTLGLGAIPWVIFRLLFWWLIPAIELEILSSLAPAVIHIDGWGSAIWVGLIMMLINLLTIGLRHG
jgi:uncharacterized membrane protein YvlD (DUF360 family)